LEKNVNFFYNCVGNYIISKCEEWSERPFIIDKNSAASYTYEQYFDEIRSSLYYLDKIGLEPDDFIVIEMENSVSALALLMASIVRRIIPIIVSPDTKLNEIQQICRDCSPSAIFYSMDNEGNEVCISDIKVLPINHGVGSSATEINLLSNVNSDDIAYIIYTSGSTGVPKRVNISHHNMLVEIDSMSEAYGLTKDDCHMCILPLYHASGLYRNILLAFHVGGSVTLYKEFRYDTFWSDIQNEGITFVQIVPFIAKSLLAHKEFFINGQQNRLKFIGSASAAHPVRLIKEFEENFGVYLLQGYGMTEATCGITLNPLNKENRRLGSVGKPLTVNNIQILDQDNKLLPSKTIGRIVVLGDNISNFVDEKTDNSQPGILETGDIGYLDEENFLWLSGRNQDIIKRAGYRISPYEIEDAILKIYPNLQVCVIGVQHDLLGQDIVAFASREEDELSARDIIKELKFNLASYKIPSEIIFLDNIPLIGVGKVDKVKLKELYKSMFS